MKRDDFSLPTKRALAMRAAYFCSNPRCLKLTAGPKAHDTGGVASGCAAHINAASIGGPRRDDAQTSEDRRSIANGIWLCRECGDIVDNDHAGYPIATLKGWKRDHEAMIAEVRTEGWSRSLELLRASRTNPALAEKIIALFEDRRVFWARFDVEFPDRVRASLDQLRFDLTRLRRECVVGGPLDVLIAALGSTIRHFFVSMEWINLATLKCDGRDPEWLAFESALKMLRKSIGFQIGELAASYSIPIQGEFADCML